MTSPSQRASSKGFLYAILAYGSWGLIPLYWKPFGAVSPLEILSHRMLWSLLLLAVFVVAMGQTAEVRSVLRHGRRLAALLLTAGLLSVNWGLYIYGVTFSQIVQTSLGYFLNPLVSILLAFVFLREKLTRWQIAAVVLATCGVLHFGWHVGQIPWLSLGLAVTFGFYGLVRKIVSVTPLVGLLVETALMTPAAIGIILSLSSQDRAMFGSSPHLTLLFLGAGVVTTFPLLWFNSAAKLLRLSTMGFLQFLAPTLQLLIGVLIYGEAFSPREAISFLLIWAAIAIYLGSHWRSREMSLPVPNAD